MVVALRVAAALLAALWAVLFFALVDLSIIFMWNDYFADVVPLEASWGAFLTFFMVVPLIVVAVRPRRYGEAVLLAAVTTVAIIIGAALAADPRPLWLAAAAAVSGAVVLALGVWGRNEGVPSGVLNLRVTVPMAILAVAGVPLWWPYIAHAASAQGVLPGDMSLGIDHWPVQAAAGIAVMLAAFLAAVLVEVRVLAAIAAAMPASAIGVTMVASAGLPVATESALWSVFAVLWGTTVALALAAARRRPADQSRDGNEQIPTRPTAQSDIAGGTMAA